MPYADSAKRREAQRRYEQRRKKRRGDRHVDNRERMARVRAEKRKLATFIGVDGEGWEVNGRHEYMLLCAGDRSLYKGRPLTTFDCLAFIGKLPVQAGRAYVSFFFDYDVTMILRDLAVEDPELMAEIVSPLREFGRLHYWRDFGIEYLPKKFLTVQRPGYPRVTIHDTRGFFQTSFANALDKFAVGTKRQRTRIRSMKAKRSKFATVNVDRIERYCQEECELLARMMVKLNQRFAEVDIPAYPYEGPGRPAGSVLTRHVGRAKQGAYRDLLPARVIDFAKRAYYGGRFETGVVGRVGRPVWQYDIRSAYPAAMLDLPCLEHGRWVRGVESQLYVAHVRHQAPGWENYRRDAEAGAQGDENALPWRLMGPLPHRIRKTGAIVYPLGGEGWYWSPEIPPYAEPVEAWSYVKQCDCVPFSWVLDLYEQRRAMDSETKGSGIALKLTLNSLYGKLAQRIGKAPFYNPIWSGLITSMTRAKVFQVYRDHPEQVVMFATDAVFTTCECPELPISGKLGEWSFENDEKPYDDLVIFRPGIYFDGGTAHFKTRGIPKKEFQDRADEFALSALSFERHDLPYLTVDLERTNHVSIRSALGYATNHKTKEINFESVWFDRIGEWLPQPRTYDPNPAPKRLPLVNEERWAPARMAFAEPTHPYDHESAQPWEVTTSEDPSAMEVAEGWDDGHYDHTFDEHEAD